MRALVAYFSHSGITRGKAEELAKKIGADSFEIKAKVPYTDHDVDWRDETTRNVREYRDASSRPEIESMPDLDGVDALYVGYPIWWYTHPRIINTFFDKADLAGKEIHLFATSGGTGINGSLDELRRTYPNANIVDGKRL